jgi:hypothetical protein
VGKRHATSQRVTGPHGNRHCDEGEPVIPTQSCSSGLAPVRVMVLTYPLVFVFALALPPNARVADSVRTDRDIRLAALRHVADVKRCYEREGLARNPALAGTLDVTVTVLATGVVSDATAENVDMDGIAAREVARCLTTAIRNWRFDRGPYQVETIVFPFRFSPVDTRERAAIATS